MRRTRKEGKKGRERIKTLKLLLPVPVKCLPHKVAYKYITWTG
jgi:hypothetical protein